SWIMAVTSGAGTPLDLGRRARRPSTAQRRALLLRDRSCRFPGCESTRHLHAHHVQFWSRGGPTDLGNLVTLCTFHHRFVHDHGWRVESAAAGTFRFGPPDGSALPTARPLHVADDAWWFDPDEGRPLRPVHRDGHHDLDLDAAVDVLHQELRLVIGTDIDVGGWATSFVGGYYGFGFEAPKKHYTITFSIAQEWVDALQIAPQDVTAEIKLTVVKKDAGHNTAVAGPPVPAYQPYGSTPIVTNPDPASLPDLVALPGWGMSIFKRKGREYLGFNATEWNAGPGTMVVEGFRGPNEDRMDAFQYFLIDGEPVSRAPIGELEYHAGGGHNHWHFEEFTQYSLLDASLSEILISGKQSWCLVNTDAIDLTLPGANMLGYSQDLFTSCGGPGALWIREILDVGWGDTYSQYVGGQAFDITDLPNGTYYVRVHVNPTGSMFELDDTNNIEDRLIKLKGKPGKRRVVVSAWHGIEV
ncbi:MAG: lysyl oxidase family protein, partial [Actinomycetota bacterium]